MHEKHCIRNPSSRLDGAMALLDARSRHVMELWLEGESLREIAEIIGLPERAVALIRSSALWRLRDVLTLEAPAEDADCPQMRPK